MAGGVYLAMGLLFSVFFLWKGIEKVDAHTEGAGLVFKLLFFPGMCVFWPLFLKRWFKAKKS